MDQFNETRCSRTFSGTIVKNMEACNVVKSSHFNMASELLEVCVCVFFPSNAEKNLIRPGPYCLSAPASLR